MLDRIHWQQLKISSSFCVVHYASECNVNTVAKDWSEDHMSRNKCKYGKNKIVIKYFRTCIVSYDIKEYDVVFSDFFPFVLKQNRVSASESTNKTSNRATVLFL